MMSLQYTFDSKGKALGVFVPLQEWQQMVIADGQYTMQSPLLRARWQQLRKWYPREIQDFVEGKLLSNTQ